MIKEYGFWLTNISNTNISLSDLNFTIKARKSVNLMDKKHFKYSFDELEKSAISGSISKRKGKLFVRTNKPEPIKSEPLTISEAYMPSRATSIFEIKVQNYEELNVSDEKFAEDNADLADTDAKIG